MMTLALIVGLWTTNCIQTQINGATQGHVLESYEISEAGGYEFTREWFHDASCTESFKKDSEAGTLKLGPRMSGMFVTGQTFEADFTSEGAKDLGAIRVTEGESLKIARGLKGSSFRNTMVGIFDYTKR